ncbi:Selenocysteine-specific elongation factor [Methylobacterium aerolatum]|nr:Selenocysteine-specific elongation factor [Methylobacterium aerolatum]
MRGAGHPAPRIPIHERRKARMIVATAGHIDHGKTSLVKALTGIDADRLPEEKARGITVDLGFAYARFGAHRLGFVDVPGHERLVRTMVAGATGVGFALIVVAADDGVMPQTREHIAILDLLGLRRGLVAITKSDRVEGARLAAVEAEIRGELAGSGLATAPILTCSALTGAGIAAIAERLERAAAGTAVRSAEGGFRLAVDRCFTIPGAGLVVTGAVHAGTVAVGDRLLVSPGGAELRVRSIRAEDEAVAAAGVGQRCALNVTGPRLSREAIHRGDWILAPDLDRPVRHLDVALRLLPGEERALRHRTPVHVHLGAASATGRVLLPPGTVIEPGRERMAQITLDAGIGALHGDRFVLRDISASRTLGGGRIIDIAGTRRGGWTPGRRAVVAALDEADHAAALAGVLALEETGVDLDHFARARNIPGPALATLEEKAGTVVLATAKARIGFARARIEAVGAAILSLLADSHRIEPDSLGLTAQEIGDRLSKIGRAVLRAALDRLIGGGAVARRGPLHHLPGHDVRLAGPEAELYDAVRVVLAGAGLDQPRLADLATRVACDAETLRPLLDKCGRIGWLRRVSSHYYVLPEVLGELARRAHAVAAEHPQALLTVGRFREATGISRNITMPLLTYFDACGLTVRVADGRTVRAEVGEI